MYEQISSYLGASPSLQPWKKTGTRLNSISTLAITGLLMKSLSGDLVTIERASELYQALL